MENLLDAARDNKRGSLPWFFIVPGTTMTTIPPNGTMRKIKSIFTAFPKMSVFKSVSFCNLNFELKPFLTVFNGY